MTLPASIQQRERRKQKREAGLCELCPLPRERARHCARHRRHFNRRQTERETLKRNRPKLTPGRCGGCHLTGHNVRTCRGRSRELLELEA